MKALDIIGAALFSLLVCSCAWTPRGPLKVYDGESMSDTEIAILRTARRFTYGICIIDGKTVYEDSLIMPPRYIFHLKPGIHTIGVGRCVDFPGMHYYYFISIHHVTFEFEAGHEYYYRDRLFENQKIVDRTTNETLFEW